MLSFQRLRVYQLALEFQVLATEIVDALPRGHAERSDQLIPAACLKLANDVADVRGIFEALSGKLGMVLLVLGFMHFFNLIVFTKMRKRATWHQAPPPLPPAGIQPRKI